LPETPLEAAQMALDAIGPSTEVSTSGLANVAGRDAYEIRLTPRDGSSLVESVRIALDAENYTPLQVLVYSTQLKDPAISVGFTSVSFDTPDADLFRFEPPGGATVVDGAIERPDLIPGVDVQVVGSGWSAVLVGTLSESDKRNQGRELLEMLPGIDGPWGQGNVFTGTLFSAIVTTDGRFAVGAVDSETLGEALGVR
jgi:hypothetical protein